MSDSPNPTVDVDPRYGDPDEKGTSWADGQAALRDAELDWVATVRPDGQPHVTPVVGVWVDGAVVFTTGDEEQKARNLAAHDRCTVTTGNNTWNRGLDLVVEGRAVRVSDPVRLQRVVDEFARKYHGDWVFEVDGDRLRQEDGGPVAFEVRPERAYAFAKGPFSHTRWRFPG
jgi:nitroimidazol reductase NimA-like FMN-containing flavoprotein (pyridoxamine 5'-phosphate oxidase superfamily)